MQCDMCGDDTRLVIAIIEGTQLRVCNKCSKFGKVIKKIEEAPKRQGKKEQGLKEIMKEPSRREVIQIINPDYAYLIKTKREALKLNQEDFAKKINEKSSLMQKIETGNMEPGVALARKIERFLKIKIIEQYEEEHGKLEMVESVDSWTIGDMIKFKKKSV